MTAYLRKKIRGRLAPMRKSSPVKSTMRAFAASKGWTVAEAPSTPTTRSRCETSKLRGID